MEEKKIENKKIRLAIIVGIIGVVILLLLGLSRCSDNGSGSETASKVQEETAEKKEEEIELPENPSIGETVTGEEIQDEDGLVVSDKDMDSDPTGLSSGDKLYGTSSDKSNTDSGNNKDDKPSGSGTDDKKDEDSKDEDSEDEKQPEEEKKPVGEEDSGQASEEDSTNTKHYGNLY